MQLPTKLLASAGRYTMYNIVQGVLLMVLIFLINGEVNALLTITVHLEILFR